MAADLLGNNPFAVLTFIAVPAILTNLISGGWILFMFAAEFATDRCVFFSVDIIDSKLIPSAVK